MAKEVILIVTGLIIVFGKPSFESKTFEKFCDSGIPEVINNTGTGEGEIKVDLISLARSWLIHVNKDNNNGIDLNFKSFLLEDFFLVIHDGMGIGSGDSMVQLISGQSDKPLLFRIPFAKSFYVEICPENAPVSNLIHANFTLSFKRTGSEDELPEEKPDIQIEKESYEVQFQGKDPEKFKESKFILELKEVIKKLARDYCEVSHINFDEEKSADEMVTILAVRYCPEEWYDRANCASIKHSVYVTREHKAPTAVWNYELRRKHLHEMWAKANDSYFKDLGLCIYKFPNKDELLGWWFVLTVLPAIIFIFAAIYTLKICTCVNKEKQKKHSAGTESMTTDSRRKTKLKPNKYQNIPSFIKDQRKTDYLYKNQHLDNVDGQVFGERMYFGSLLFSKIPRNYSSHSNDAS